MAHWPRHRQDVQMRPYNINEGWKFQYRMDVCCGDLGLLFHPKERHMFSIYSMRHIITSAEFQQFVRENGIHYIPYTKVV